VLLAACLAGLVRSQSCAGCCQDTSNSCPNQYFAGECPGPSNIQCCPEPTPDCNGQCQDNSLPCSGSYVANECPGPSNVQCCTSSPPPPSGGKGVDVSDSVSSSAASCLAGEGYSWAVVRAWRSYGAFDSSAPGSLSAFQSAGITADVYLFPCAGMDAATQVQQMVSSLQGAGSTWGTIWLDIESNPSSGCAWTDANTNCNFIGTMITTAQGLVLSVGVYASEYMWSIIPGGTCTVGSGVPLWYANYDNVEDCSDFAAFGGWGSAAWHQWSDAGGDCGVSYDINVQCSSAANTTARRTSKR